MVRDYLIAHPGATKDRIYDEVISRMVRAGVVQTHNFDELLAQIAEDVRESVLKNLFEAKSRGRTSGTNRRIKRYVAFLEQGVAIPERERSSDATLAEWIRHCKRSGLYEQGKLLYERGGLNLDGLSEEAQVSVEEDYETCARMLSRSNDRKQIKKGKERKDGPERLFQ